MSYYEMVGLKWSGKMKQVKYFITDKKANAWIKENLDMNIIDIKFSAGGFAVVYEEKFSGEGS